MGLIRAIVLIASALAGYQQLFSTFAAYDDEGYVMISLRSYLDGHPLYDETYSQYGPAFYQLRSVIHRLPWFPLTHRNVRLLTLAIWSVVALLCAQLIQRLTGSRAWATMGLLFVFFHLDKLALEPGHPQELAALAVAAVLLVGAGIRLPREPCDQRPSGHAGQFVRLGLLGIICGAACLTKVNAGLLLTTACWLAILQASETGPCRNRLQFVSVTGALLLPAGLYGDHLRSVRTWPLPLVACLALAALALGPGIAGLLRRSPESDRRCADGTLRLSGAGVFASTLVVTIIGSLAWQRLQGTSWSGLWYGLVTQHVGFAAYFYHDPGISWWAVGAAALSLLAALWYARDNDAPPWSRWLASIPVISCAAAYVMETTRPLTHGLEPRAAASLLVGFGAPLMWVLVVPPCDSPTPFARHILARVAALAPLIAFPTPGTQLVVGSFPLLVGTLVLLADATNADVAFGRPWRGDLLPAVGYRGSVLVAGLWILAVATLIYRGVYLTDHRQRLCPLDLPGTEGLRLDPQFVAQRRWLVRQLEDTADTFVFAEHGHNSLYFWTRIDPPTHLNTTFWPFLLTAAQQARIVQALEHYARPVIVHCDFGAPLPDGPLRRYVRQGFPCVRQNGTWQLWYNPIPRLEPDRGQRDARGSVPSSSTADDGSLSRGAGSGDPRTAPTRAHRRPAHIAAPPRRMTVRFPFGRPPLE